MQIRIKDDSVEIDGYVNAVERKSKVLKSRMGDFIEKICKGAFTRALGRADDVRILLNHNPERDLGGIKDGNLELTEDSIGLKARAIIKDTDVVEKARRGDLVGWSFGFMDRDVENKRDEDGLPLRNVRDLDLVEVSILDRTRTPAYDGTLVSVRDDNSIFIGESFEDDVQIREENEEVKEEPKQPETVEVIDYSKWDSLIAEMKN